VCKGVAKLTVDAAEVAGNTLPLFGDGKTHRVQVEMGS
jgi:cellobiose phosphorylase